MSRELRVAVAAPISREIAEIITRAEPRIHLDWDPALLPQMRHTADFAGDPSFRRSALQQQQFDQALVSADALYGVPDLSPRALSQVVSKNDRLRWVHTMAAGGGAIVRDARLPPEKLLSVTFTTSAGVHGAPLAEFVVFGLLAGAKRLPRLRADQSSRNWPLRWEMEQLAGTTVLVLGTGGIGKAVARLVRAFGATPIGISRSGQHVPEFASVRTVAEMTATASEADHVVVALPGTAATENLVSTDFFANVKAGTTLVNVGRGGAIDEVALVEALDAGQVGYAVLDVTAIEPLPAASPLWEHPNVLISPHTAALSRDEERRIAELFAENARRLLDDQPLRNVVDTVHYY